MPSTNRRAAARRRAWGRGPVILRFEPLEGRQLLSTTPLPDLVGSAFDTLHNLDWGDSFHAIGQVTNQGAAAESGPFNVEVFASTSPVIGPGSVPLGEIPISGNLAPGASAKFDQILSLPATPIPGFSASSSQTIYIGVLVDPENSIVESNKANNNGVGQGFDTSVVTITPHQPSNLIGSSLGVYPDQAAWGNTVTVTAQIRNNAQGDAPATRARIVLTPAGQNPGGTSDVTVGNISVPAIPAWQTVNVVQSITLPAGPPTTLAAGSQFVLSMVQDADFLTNPVSPRQATQGLGLDMAVIGISPGRNSAVPQGALPDLAASTVLAPTQPLAWGQNFQVVANVENLGHADAAPFRVRFLLTGSSGSLSPSIFLGDAIVNGLKAGFSQNLVQTLRLPGRLPNGWTLSSVGTGRIAVVVDPESTIDEQLKTNNVAESSPVTLKVLGTDGTSTVPTAPAVTTTPNLGQPKPAGKAAAKTTQSAAHPRLAGTTTLHRRATPKPNHSIQHELKVFPTHVTHFFKDLFKKH